MGRAQGVPDYLLRFKPLNSASAVMVQQCWQTFLKSSGVKARPGSQGLLIRDRCCVSVEFCDGYSKRLGVGTRHVAKNAECDGLSKQDRHVAVAAPVDAGVNSVSEADVVGQLVQLAIDGEWT